MSDTPCSCPTSYTVTIFGWFKALQPALRAQSGRRGRGRRQTAPAALDGCLAFQSRVAGAPDLTTHAPRPSSPTISKLPNFTPAGQHPGRRERSTFEKGIGLLIQQRLHFAADSIFFRPPVCIAAVWRDAGRNGRIPDERATGACQTGCKGTLGER
jgi:hypothetical protein